jgi:hypothetical protein
MKKTTKKSNMKNKHFIVQELQTYSQTGWRRNQEGLEKTPSWRKSRKKAVLERMATH